MLTFLIRSASSQSSSYPIVLTRLGGPRSRPSPHLKFFGRAGDRTRDLMISSQTCQSLDQRGGLIVHKTNIRYCVQIYKQLFIVTLKLLHNYMRTFFLLVIMLTLSFYGLYKILLILFHHSTKNIAI